MVALLFMISVLTAHSQEQAVFLYPFGGEIMELKDNVQLMQSDDYKDRFRAEY